MASTPKVLMQRSLHPVGQGAFYTEQFLVSKKPFEKSQMMSVVYDCGSLNVSLLQDEITKLIPKGNPIDLMFLSHFDEDHINGMDYLIKRCKSKRYGHSIKYLVLPLLDVKQLIIAFLETGITDYSVRALMKRFNAEKVIFVKPISINDIERDRITREFPQANNTPVSKYGSLPLDNNTPTLIESGTGLSGSLVNEWIYIPFNAVDHMAYDEFSRFIKQNRPSIFETFNKMTEVKGDVNNISDIRFGLSEWEEIKSIYKEFHRNHKISKNSSSLLVYSGPSLICANKTWKRQWRIDFTYNNQRSGNKNRIIGYSSQVAAIYTGDIKLTSTIRDKTNTSTTVLKYIIKMLDSVVNHIGLIQIPHHGSKYNFDPDIVSFFPKSFGYFVSYSTDNHFKHPFPGIKMILLSESKEIIDITENPTTEYTQIIKKI